jgi:hypothetical protein
VQPQWEVADVLQHTDITTSTFTARQQKTLRALQQCRTAALGGHVDVCSDCGVVHISYNSCRNRHCPKCQGHKKQEWIQRREAELLPCTYFHVVFTLPQQLNPLALYNPKVVYDALFAAAWQTLHQFGKTAGVQMGMIAVLHTWGQNLSLHPHLHCIVPGAGINAKQQWQLLPHSSKPACRTGRYLFPVKALSKVFRAQYVHYLRSHGIKDRPLFDSLYQQDWVVYAKRPFGTAMQVIEYLGRYTHKVAISNHRLKEVTTNEVSFSYKDYRAKGQTKTMTLSNDEFTRRFAQHILPHRFVRIRHYGILSSSWKRGKLQALQVLLKVVTNTVVVKTLLHQCRCCKTGTLITIEVFGKRGPPKQYLLDKQAVPVS